MGGDELRQLSEIRERLQHGTKAIVMINITGPREKSNSPKSSCMMGAEVLERPETHKLSLTRNKSQPLRNPRLLEIIFGSVLVG